MSMPETTPGITPVPRLFTYHIFGTPPEHREYLRDETAFRLTVSGLVEREQQLSVRQLREDFEPVRVEMILQCMTNIHWGRISIIGARLLDVLEASGIRSEARKIALHAADGFASDLRLDEVRDDPDAFLLAYAMNDEPLSLDHGFPVRVAADGRYGYKWPKWLCEVELVDHDFKGHYEGHRGWSDVGTRGLPVT